MDGSVGAKIIGLFARSEALDPVAQRGLDPGATVDRREIAYRVGRRAALGAPYRAHHGIESVRRLSYGIVETAVVA